VQYAAWHNVDARAIRRVGEYAVEYDLLKLTDVAAKTKHMADEYINPAGNDVTEAFKTYAGRSWRVAGHGRIAAPRVQDQGRIVQDKENPMAESRVSYKELGIVNTRAMFKAAMVGKFAVPAYNFNNMEQMQAIVMAAWSRIRRSYPGQLGRAQVRQSVLLRFLARARWP